MTDETVGITGELGYIGRAGEKKEAA
jgi:hypothetical protein